MKTLLAGDTQETKRLYSAQDPISEVLQRNYRLVSVVKNADIYYILYTFADDKKPSMLRVAVNGDKIEDIKTGSQLGAVPSDDKPESNSQTANKSTCLAKTDLVYLDSTSIYARDIRGATMIFPLGSTEYIETFDSKVLLDRMVNFYKEASYKDFVFELRGYRQSSGLSQEEVDTLNDLYQRRAVSLQNELVKRGVPLDRVTVSDRLNYYLLEQVAGTDNEQFIDINVVNRCIKE